MKHIYASLLLLLLYTHCIAQPDDSIRARIIVISDAGRSLARDNNFLSTVKNNTVLDSNTIVLFLGLGTTDTNILRYEADLIDNTKAKAFFVPGYYDWAEGEDPGYKNVRAQQSFLKGLDNKRIKFYPGDGCPGPKDIELNTDVALLIMDSQWWLQEDDKPGIESDCPFRTKDEVLVEVEDAMERYADRLVLFATYHPFRNIGIHSGRFGLKQHFFPLTDVTGLKHFYLPLPVVGSLYPVSRNVIAGRQDMNNARYTEMLTLVDKFVKAHPQVIYLSGQEHNMQLLFDGKGHYYAGSSSTTPSTRVRHTRDGDFAMQAPGYTVLEVSGNKKLHVRFYEIQNDKPGLVYASGMLDCSVFPQPADTAKMPYIRRDSTVASANEKYMQAGKLKKKVSGNNYRDIWAAKVKMEVFHIDKEKGGLKITGLGGGHQSKSLQMEDANGEKWVLRTVNKDLEEVTPENFRETIASDMAQDMISSSNPYGALPVPVLLDALQVPHATPKVVFVPNDTALGKYRPYFANTVCMLEERDPKLNDHKTYDTYDAINDMIDNADFVDQRMFLRSRLIDFLIADFDRHYAQMKWGTIDTSNGKIYYPIPKDRDQAFFNSDGVLLKLAKGRLGYMQGFNGRIRDITTMGFVARDLDKFFLNELNENDWKNTLALFKNNLDDSVISEAVHRLPPEVYAMYGERYRKKLIERRNELAEKGMDYYRFLSHRVNITGTNKDDIFEVSEENNGLWVKVYAKKKGDTVLQYARWFDPAVTKEINLYGFGGKDYFGIDKASHSDIKFNIVGGRGDDVFNMKGSVKNSIYDNKTEDNRIVSRIRTTNMLSDNFQVNDYRFRENIHDVTRFPMITLAANEADGILAGIGIARTTYAFRKEPFATHQQLSTLVSLSRPAWQVKYRGEFNNVLRYKDIVARAEVIDQALNNFFGYGNETVIDPARSRDYYHTRYKYAAADFLLRKRIHNRKVVSIAAGPSMYYYLNSVHGNHSRILEYPSVAGLDSESVFTKKFYAGGKLEFRINNVTNELLPKRGMDWATVFTVLKDVGSSTEPLLKLESDMTVYATLSHPARLMSELHFGGGHIFSDHFEYYQALSIGFQNFPRGFRRNRFTGSSMAYASAELKWKMFALDNYVLKGDVGLVGFGDVGRIWMKGEHSDLWHNSYGGGLYFTPFNYVIASLTAAISNEDTFFFAGFGTKINIIF